MRLSPSISMNGILIIDKPKGLTSHDVVRRVRRRLKIRRVGHAGTLDPMATGILQVAVGEGTRIVQFLMEGEKTYRAVLRLGEITDTQDAEGKVLTRRPVEGLSREDIEAACRSFVGRIRQVPPMYSALKKDGVPLHRLARQGIEVVREAREVEIRRLQVGEVQLPHVSLEVDCSKGTYIRTLAHDLGAALGPGAHLISLRRVRSGPFVESDCLSLEELEGDHPATGCPGLLSLQVALRNYPALQVTTDAASRLQNGMPPVLQEVSPFSPGNAGDVVLLLRQEHLLAVARYAPLRERERRGDFELLRVFPNSAAG